MRFQVENDQQLERLIKFVDEMNLDQWSESRVGNVDVLFPPHLLDTVEMFGLEYSVYIEDLQVLIDNESIMNAMVSNSDADFFKKYHSNEEIVVFMKGLANKYPNLVTMTENGRTIEDRPQYLLRVTSQRGTNKTGMFFHSLTHAREWVSGATLLYIIDQLLENYGTEPVATKLLDELEWFFVPVVNVDGYEYTWNSNRMWRKNRRINQGSSCVGVDNNRNWAYGWRSGESPCSETFSGASAFSEPETKALADVVTKHPNIKGYIDIHSYSELLMWAYGATRDLPKDSRVLQECGHRMIKAIENVHGKKFRAGPIYTTIYAAYGSSVDWVYDTAGVTFTYTFELRDTGRYGFVLPPDQIIPSGEEIYASIKEMGLYIIDYYRTNSA